MLVLDHPHKTGSEKRRVGAELLGRGSQPGALEAFENGIDVVRYVAQDGERMVEDTMPGMWGSGYQGDGRKAEDGKRREPRREPLSVAITCTFLTLLEALQ